MEFEIIGFGVDLENQSEEVVDRGVLRRRNVNPRNISIIFQVNASISRHQFLQSKPPSVGFWKRKSKCALSATALVGCPVHGNSDFLDIDCGIRFKQSILCVWILRVKRRGVEPHI